jgi:iron complex transport system substrate-binding protein
MKKKAFVVLLVCLMALSLFAQPVPEQAPVASDTVSYTDDLGRTVTLPAKIDRILPAGLISQYVLFPLAADTFVGLSVAWNDSAKGIVDAKYLDIPYAGQIYGGKATFNMEEVLRLDPQVVIDVGERKKTISEDLDKIQNQLGIPVIHIDASTATMDKAYAKLGSLLGLETQAKELGDYCAQTLSRIRTITAPGKVKGIYVVGEKGINVLAKDSYQGETVDMLMDNLAVVENPSSRGTGNEVDMERILSWNPPYVIFAGDAKPAFEKAPADPIWSQVSAVKDGHIFLSPDVPAGWIANPPSVNRFLGLLWGAKKLYPDRATYDLKTEVKRYFSLFYHADLTDAEIVRMIGE